MFLNVSRTGTTFSIFNYIPPGKMLRNKKRYGIVSHQNEMKWESGNKYGEKKITEKIISWKLKKTKTKPK